MQYMVVSTAGYVDETQTAVYISRLSRATFYWFISRVNLTFNPALLFSHAYNIWDPVQGSFYHSS
jgi:hypothetical protein